VEVVADYNQQKEIVLKRIQEWQNNQAAKEGRKRKSIKKEEEETDSKSLVKAEKVEQPVHKKVVFHATCGTTCINVFCLHVKNLE
jgi:hypothetical protein